jgi:hypothetical protein
VANRDPPICDFFQKAGKIFPENRGMNANSSYARAFANPSHGTLRRYALGVVRGDEPDCSGKHNLLTALIGLQRAADRRGNRGARFRALVLQGATCGSECHRGPRCVIATSTATIRVPVDHPTIDHRERLRDRRSEIAADPFGIFPKKKFQIVAADRSYRPRMFNSKYAPLVWTARAK